MLILGIDSGSTTTKGVLFDGKNVLDSVIVSTGSSPKEAMKEVYRILKKDNDVYTVTTGYGRNLLEGLSDKSVTEITCHGKGASYLCPGISAVIDIGGQDSKVIKLDRDSNIVDFAMNDKCAAGTGRFIEVMMRTLKQEISNIDSFIEGENPLKISSMCTVFAESEIVSLLAKEEKAESIAMGIVDSICERTAIFARKLNFDGSIFFSGGLSKSKVITSVLSEKLMQEVLTHENSQLTGAIGAAVIGSKKIRG